MRTFLIIFLATLLCLKVALTASKKDESSEENENDTKEPLPGVGVITQPILQAVTLNHPNYRNDLGSSRFFAELLAKNKASIKIEDNKSDEEDDEENDGGEEGSSEKRDSDDGESDDDDGDDDKKSDDDRDGDGDDGDSDDDKKSGEDKKSKKDKKSGEGKKSKDDDDSEESKSKAIKNRRDTGTGNQPPLCILFGGYGPKTKNWY